MEAIRQIELRLPNEKNEKLMKAANKLESNFLSEMLKSAGVGESRESFGGGIGEDQFSGFLVQEYATAMVEAGGIGLAEHIYNALLKQDISQ